MLYLYNDVKTDDDEKEFKLLLQFNPEKSGKKEIDR
jgi:hypothetical protein